jgi:hypothetical protein
VPLAIFTTDFHPRLFPPFSVSSFSFAKNGGERSFNSSPEYHTFRGTGDMTTKENPKIPFSKISKTISNHGW